MKKYEYKIVEATPSGKWEIGLDLEANEAILTGLGLEGWELVQIHDHALASGIKRTLFFLKRELAHEELV
ncbi:MAG: DUF4177 domain-containing protein [Saprospiraceae bacterium]|nr:DUF4177 domain-containing protein [Lewinella sp.]